MASTHHWNGVLDSALDAVGETPLIRLDRIAKAEGLKCNLLGKAEFFSVGGSVKDRIAKRMVEQAEKNGILIPGQSVVIEPTSGNTGIGLALACAIKGYKCIITLPAKMSLEKEVLLRSLGAEVVRTPHDSPDSLIGVAERLKEKIPGGVILDQYSNPNNPLAHYYTTYGEIAHALKTSNLRRKSISALIAGAGTGGTITGLARAVRDSEKDGASRATVVAVDPVGSILGGGDVGQYQVEGIGYDFFPAVLDPKPPLIDEWIKTNDDEAFAACKRIIRQEGLAVGGSSGSALAGALKFLKSEEGKAIAEDPTANVVVVFPDGVRNYMSKEWFLKQEEGSRDAELHDTIRELIGRDLDDPYLKKKAATADKVNGSDSAKPNGVHATAA
ncbi:cystathionine beta-synthase [Vanrija albida]|uniref:Cystathionine beta-synthase n=1 Tax=Vanrija albida TaxID=181172 RepID=A0ABR3Q5S3_9TREE